MQNTIIYIVKLSVLLLRLMLTISLMLVGVLVISMVSTNNTAQSSTHEYPVGCCEISDIIGDSVGAMDYNQA